MLGWANERMRGCVDVWMRGSAETWRRGSMGAWNRRTQKRRGAQTIEETENCESKYGGALNCRHTNKRIAHSAGFQEHGSSKRQSTGLSRCKCAKELTEICARPNWGWENCRRGVRWAAAVESETVQDDRIDVSCRSVRPRERWNQGIRCSDTVDGRSCSSVWAQKNLGSNKEIEGEGVGSWNCIIEKTRYWAQTVLEKCRSANV